MSSVADAARRVFARPSRGRPSSSASSTTSSPIACSSSASSSSHVVVAPRRVGDLGVERAPELAARAARSSGVAVRITGHALCEQQVVGGRGSRTGGSARAPPGRPGHHRECAHRLAQREVARRATRAAARGGARGTSRPSTRRGRAARRAAPSPRRPAGAASAVEVEVGAREADVYSALRREKPSATSSSSRRAPRARSRVGNAQTRPTCAPKRSIRRLRIATAAKSETCCAVIDADEHLERIGRERRPEAREPRDDRREHLVARRPRVERLEVEREPEQRPDDRLRLGVERLDVDAAGRRRDPHLAPADGAVQSPVLPQPWRGRARTRESARS